MLFMMDQIAYFEKNIKHNFAFERLLADLCLNLINVSKPLMMRSATVHPICSKILKKIKLYQD